MNPKTLVFLIPLGILLVMAISITALEARRTPDWQAALDAYLADNSLQADAVRQVARARYPATLTTSIGVPVSADWRWQIERLPHPPQELYCALVQFPGETGAAQRQIVYVGYLTDTLYRAGWITYAGPRSPFSPQVSEHLTTLGCDLTLTTP